MIILGFNGGGTPISEEDKHPARHDAAAVLLVDGKVKSAIEEERLDRLKHSNCFPENAIRFCLKEAGITLRDVDAVVTNTSERTVSRWAKAQHLWSQDSAVDLDPAAYIARSFQRAFDIDVTSKIRFCPHHLAHAVSAFVPSGVSESLILAIDGDGDGVSGAVMLGRQDGIERLREFNYQQSLGHLYTESISLLGYGMFDEYKAMGLAPYGDTSVFAGIFEKHYRLLDYGNYHLDPLPRWIESFDSAGLLQLARRKGEPFTQTHKDFAAALQLTIENIILHIVEFYRKDTRQRNLCLAGGVAHNCSCNGRLLYTGWFDRVYVQPAAHDAGGALGAAYQEYHSRKGVYPIHFQPHVYWGSQICEPDRIREQLEAWKAFLSFEEVDDVGAVTANLLAEDAVVGWVQGRSEFGPRALGNRSILADPRPSYNKERINEMIKKREGYRPFAPSVLEEYLEENFEVSGSQSEFHFMTFVMRVLEEKRALLGAITHVDGSARVQTVSKASNELYWHLIDEFRRLTNVPMVLNTSFNNHAEPIVDSVADAIACFLTTGLNHLVIGRFVVSKTVGASDVSSIQPLLLQIAPGYKLVHRRGDPNRPGSAQNIYQIESMRNPRFRRSLFHISEAVFHILHLSDGKKDIGHLAQMAGVTSVELGSVLTEVSRLWEERVVLLKAT